jgi:hypothetical protein
VILRRGADHRRAADVDVLDRLRARHARSRHRFLERVERHHHEIDRLDLVFLERGQMRRHVTTGQEAPVDPRMEGFDPPVEHLGKAGDVRDFPNRDGAVPEKLGGAAGRENLDAKPGQGLGERDDAGLVVNADQRPPDLHRMMTLRPTTSRRPSANRRTASG